MWQRNHKHWQEMVSQLLEMMFLFFVANLRCSLRKTCVFADQFLFFIAKNKPQKLPCTMADIDWPNFPKKTGRTHEKLWFHIGFPLIPSIFDGMSTFSYENWWFSMPDMPGSFGFPTWAPGSGGSTAAKDGSRSAPPAHGLRVYLLLHPT